MNAELCHEAGCGNVIHCRGYCTSHYNRKRRTGDLPRKTGDARGFLLSVVLPYEGDECLIWPFSRDQNGYGQIRGYRDTASVSRIVCEEKNGPPPSPRHQAAHSCGRGRDACVTKGDVSWKTRAENEADKVDHGTVVRGERCHFAKLTEGEALQILAAKGTATQSQIAKKFGIDQSAVSHIHCGKAWGWLIQETT